MVEDKESQHHRARRAPFGPGLNFYKMQSSFFNGGKTVSEDVGTLVDEIDGTKARPSGQLDERRLVLAPDYQRPAVWTDRQASLFLGSWAEGLDLPKIFVQRYESTKTGGKEYWNRDKEVIDGQQRLRAFYRWVTGEVPAELTDGNLVWYRDTSQADRNFMYVNITYVDLTRAEQIRLYVRLNRGGTAHTDQEIEHAKELLKAEEARK